MYCMSIPYLVFLSATLYVLPFCRIASAAGCDRIFTGSGGTLASPNLEGSSTKSTYDNGLTCTYDIKLSDASKGIRLTWSKFDVKGIMPTCSNDYVEIFIGCKRHSIGKYCSNNLVGGHQAMFSVYSPDNCLRIKFHSDGSGTGGGFRATYLSIQKRRNTLVLPDTCSRYRKDYTAKAGVISSPNWPGQYPTYRDCYWTIEVGKGNGVKIAFMDFDLKRLWSSCDKNVKVEVKGSDSKNSYNSATTIKDSICGYKDPFVFHSSKKLVWIRFKNDRQSTSILWFRGFVLGYVRYKRSEGSGRTVPIIVGALVAAVVVFCCFGCYCYRRKHRFQGQRVPTNPPPPVETHPVPVPPPTQSYPMQPVAEGDPPPPSYSQVTSSGYYPPPGAHPPPPPGGVYPPGPPGGTYPPPPPGGVYPPGPPGGTYPPPPPGGVYPSGPPPPGEAYPSKPPPPGGTYPSGPPPPGGVYPSGPPPPGEPYSAPPPYAPANPGGTTPYPATAPPYPPTGGAGYPSSGTAPYPKS